MNDLLSRGIVLLFVFIAVVLAVEFVVRSAANRRAERKGVNSRLEMIERGRTSDQTLTALRRATSSVPEGLLPFVARIARRIERQVLQAQVDIAPSAVLMAVVVAPVALMLLLTVLILFWWQLDLSIGRVLLCAVLSFLFGAAIPLMVLNYKAAKMRKRVQEQFPTALDVFTRGLRAGHPVAAALELLTMELPDPIGSEFGFVVDEVTYGAQLRDALQNMADRWDLDDMRMFVVSLSVQSETGGNLAEILDNLSTVIRERQTLLMKVRALSSEGRMTATMLTLLPILTLALLFMSNPFFFFEVADDRMFVPGFTFLIILYLIGFFSIRRMVDLKV